MGRLELVVGRHKLVSWEVVVNQPIAWDWGSWGSMNGVAGRIHMALGGQVADLAVVCWN